jgi:hypothetical protein
MVSWSQFGALICLPSTILLFYTFLIMCWLTKPSFLITVNVTLLAFPRGAIRMKITRIQLMLLGVIVVLVAAACGGGATPAPTTAPADSGDTSGDSGDASSAGDPAAAVQGFFEAVYAGEDPSGFVCSTSPEIADAFRQAAEASAAAMTDAEVDASGLTYTVSDETAESAVVTVEGEVVYTVSGVDTAVPFAATPVNVVVEDGAWKLCSAG